MFRSIFLHLLKHTFKSLIQKHFLFAPCAVSGPLQTLLSINIL